MEEAVVTLAGLLLGAVTWGVSLQLKIQRMEKDLALATVAYEQLKLEHGRLKDSVVTAAMDDTELADDVAGLLADS